MKHIGIICAIKREAQPIIDSYEMEQVAVSPYPIYRRIVGSVEISLVICGLGKVVASMASQHLIQSLEVDEIVNIGICGAISDELTIGDIVYSNQFVQHDFNIDVPDKHPAWIPSIGSHITETVKPSLFQWVDEHPKTNLGVMCSGDSFVKSRVKKEQLALTTSGVSCDMESAAIAQVCWLLNCPFMSLRAVSDLAEDVPSDFVSNMELAIERVTSLFHEVTRSSQVFA
ncbi:5'-methylthioadenosine/S-adenosylhomocysteine nucleosidase [Vibrio parahaemolyticus]|uniref:5'-methylthioadenosine/S-adenosylhomocysteine nucleosidase n=1 Tax=Vibrio parahaemolyticus TaxID=670 RepID=UPI0015DF4EA9|nr:5'-methylthioadenosine/S-adenosylhomocysteine nucleosidase [Vibrio parahaemolyticus]EHH1057638.1 5'-methylthioadenosine/S-adenosylhomocysteine nucleosidase [Vibrio parahaemolyticus]MBE3972207.1 5'-methylthioadenosine/S-adenosylhomocysteine nucleosidase [Vibrio parahaemolyticus]MBE5118866.1 5'-methylthioadenosine/S-adenosylhomocysteine nucleosidase [Vibrio parahaemolyticus]MBM5041445.1 5'-methylthioadenosine/S-adenosylhomocysteine nucleosidase [Vibrio parahaemolyticus]MBM5059625.1 5'-methylt